MIWSCSYTQKMITPGPSSELSCVWPWGFFCGENDVVNIFLFCSASTFSQASREIFWASPKIRCVALSLLISGATLGASAFSYCIPGLLPRPLTYTQGHNLCGLCGLHIQGCQRSRNIAFTSATGAPTLFMLPKKNFGNPSIVSFLYIFEASFSCFFFSGLGGKLNYW